MLVGSPKASGLSLTLGAGAGAAFIEAKLLSSTGSLGLLERNFQNSRDREVQLGVFFSFFVGSLESIL